MTMIETTTDSLADHFINDLGIQPDDLVFMFSGVFGLGRLENGLDTIEDAIERAIPRGTLIVPTFSYSWSQGKSFDEDTPCPEMGSFSNYVLGLKNYRRTKNPNFSVAIRENSYNKSIVDNFINVGDDCFDENSIFGKVVQYSKTKRAWILLLGGAFNDVKYRSTFIHYAQQKAGVPHRYIKSFYSPDGGKRCVTQLVRYLSREECVKYSDKECLEFNYPVEEDYSEYGKDVEAAGLLVQKNFGYHPTRMISVKESVNFYLDMIKKNPFYCVDKLSLDL